MSENTLSRRSVLKKSAAAAVTAGGISVAGTASASYDNTLYIELDGSQGDYYIVLQDHLGSYRWVQGSGDVREDSHGVTEISGSLDDGSGWGNSPDREAELEFSNDSAAGLAETTWREWECSSYRPCHDDYYIDAWLNGSCMSGLEDDGSCNR